MPRTATIGELCALLDLTAATVRELCSKGIIKRLARGTYDLDHAIPSYCRHLREAASGRGGELAGERARLAREQADMAAMKNRQLRGELVEVGEVQRKWIGAARSIRAGVLALPTRVQARLPHLTAHDVAEIEREARAVLTELADNAD